MNAQFLRRLTGFVCLLVSVSAFAQSLQLKPGKPNAWHESGENISFQVSGAWDQQVSYTIRYDDRQAPIAEGVIPAPGGSGSFNYRATEPGILFVDIRSTGQTARTVVAVDPLKIQPLEQEPDDFDQFWQRQRDQLNGVPMDAQQFQQYVNGKSITYSFSFNNIDGRRTYGQVCIPNGPGPFPAVLILPSYGVANALPDPHFLAESANVIVATVSIHNAPVTQIDPQAYQPDDFFVPEGNYYRQAILGGRRAIDFLYTLPAFNKTQLGVFGISQGGGLACAVAGLDPRVGFLSVAVPALAEHQGHSYGKAAGFPYYVWRAEALVGRDNLSGVKSAVKYYDAIYFAKRFKGIASFYIGYQDNVCPAATGLAAFNQVQGTKMSAHFLRMGHDTPVQYYDDQLAYMRRYWGAATNDPATGLAADAGPDQLISIGQHAFLKGKVDRNGVSTENLPAQWRQISGPAQVQLMNAAGYQIEASFPLPGSYQFRFEVRDESTLEQQNFLKTLSDEITVQITEEEQPCLLQPEVQFFPPSVLGASDGSLCISIDNLPASFNWSNGQ